MRNSEGKVFSYAFFMVRDGILRMELAKWSGQEVKEVEWTSIKIYVRKNMNFDPYF